MAGFNLDVLEAALADTRGSGVSFESQAKKWENEDQGEWTIDPFGWSVRCTHSNRDSNLIVQ